MPRNARNSLWRRFIAILSVLVVASGLYGCAGQRNAPPVVSGDGPATAEEFRQRMENEARLTQVNEGLMALAVEGGMGGGLYRIGAEDNVKVSVFGVPELSQEYRVDGSGRIMMPLIGAVTISGLSLDEAEQLIATRYGESYLRNPQVSLQVTEYRSQQFTVIGAVPNPRVYTTSQQTTLIEALARAGGISEGAGDFIYLTDRVRDPDTGEMKVRSLLVTVDDLTRQPGEHNVVLGDSALVNVPRGGLVFVEGDVGRPGAYPQTSARSVLTALALAGGTNWEADRSSLRVMRQDPGTRQWISMEVSHDEIRENPELDIDLLGGDVLLVDSSPIRSAWLSTWRVITGVVFLGFRPL